jgi:hypothetical protein
VLSQLSYVPMRGGYASQESQHCSLPGGYRKGIYKW